VFLAFVRDDALPLGSFSKYTWHITNLMQVKRIFDTPEVCNRFQILTNGHSLCGQSLNEGTLFEQLPLELTQSFVKNSDGSYSLYRCRETHPDPGSDNSHHSRTNKPLAIRPLEQRTFLRVGKWMR